MDLCDVETIIKEAILEFNLQSEPEQQLETTPETRLFGKGSRLDSLGLVNLIVLIEEKVFEHTSKAITLADERAMSQTRSPFRSIQSLTEYLHTTLEE